MPISPSAHLSIYRPIASHVPSLPPQYLPCNSSTYPDPCHSPAFFAPGLPLFFLLDAHDIQLALLRPSSHPRTRMDIDGVRRLSQSHADHARSDKVAATREL
ncbi:hypothetical protein NUW54_g14265 [Trametes sanguinea]|uniref:Uncharacterized protein n=1 Tax=Trametes sanguinea TaxID=158606 RepID=A0ACC1MDC2_9APHY|nr:hypothetical protein NUW54_g14265 [Trametes sanguinea]